MRYKVTWTETTTHETWIMDQDGEPEALERFWILQGKIGRLVGTLRSTTGPQNLNIREEPW